MDLLLKLHAIAAGRGDGLRPELLAALEREAGARSVAPQHPAAVALPPAMTDPTPALPAGDRAAGPVVVAASHLAGL